MELPTELILELVEQMDIATMQSFMMANKKIHTAVKSYEQSISMSRTTQFLLPPIGNLLSSSGPERRIIAANTFPAVLELERRDTRIDSILRSTYLDITAAPFLGPLTGRQHERLVLLMKRALYHCEHIADIAANTKGAAIAQPFYDLICHGVWAVSGLPASLRNCDPFTNIHARKPQIDFIKERLSITDIAALYYLITVAGIGFVRSRKYDENAPATTEKVTVFEEAIIRHGTWLLGAQIGDGGEGKSDCARKEVSGHLLSAGLTELRDWEVGKEGTENGLRMTLLEAAKGICGEDGHIAAKLLKSLKDVVE